MPKKFRVKKLTTDWVAYYARPDGSKWMLSVFSSWDDAFTYAYNNSKEA